LLKLVPLAIIAMLALICIFERDVSLVLLNWLERLGKLKSG
jgi:hypothetical protein